MILGIDEAGRGPWAGPLVVGAVVLGGEAIDGLTDSKKLTKKHREKLFAEIQARAKAIGIGWVDSSELDDIGISQALRLATKRALQQIKTPYHEIIIDGTVNFLVDTPLEGYVTNMKKADLLVPSVSAASVIAKVSRDRYMTEQDATYPDYGFASHSGYGTVKHRQAIEKLGITPLHRLSFGPLQKYQSKNDLKNTPKKSKPSKNFKATRSIGNRSETAAVQELMRRGHQIVERNWRTKYCEIDIVSQKDDIVYFTEVKHRGSFAAEDGLEAITPKKLNQMKFAAKFYAHANEVADTSLRLMVVATTGSDFEVTAVVKVD